MQGESLTFYGLEIALHPMQWLGASSAIVPTAVELKQISFMVVLGGGIVCHTQGTEGLARLELYSYLYDYGGMLVENFCHSECNMANTFGPTPTASPCGLLGVAG